MPTIMPTSAPFTPARSQSLLTHRIVPTAAMTAPEPVPAVRSMQPHSSKSHGHSLRRALGAIVHFVISVLTALWSLIVGGSKRRAPAAQVSVPAPIPLDLPKKPPLQKQPTPKRPRGTCDKAPCSVQLTPPQKVPTGLFTLQPRPSQTTSPPLIPISVVGTHKLGRTAIPALQKSDLMDRPHAGLDALASRMAAAAKQGTLIDLWDGLNQRFLGVSPQFTKDVLRQTVFVETWDKTGNKKQAPLGGPILPLTKSAQDGEEDSCALLSRSLHAQAKHLLKICDNDLLWRFQATQLLSQNFLLAVNKAVADHEGLLVDGKPVAAMGNPTHFFFVLRRRSSQSLQVVAQSSWDYDGTPGLADDGFPKRVPFYMLPGGEPQPFVGSVQAEMKMTLLRPKDSDAPPRFKDLTVHLEGLVRHV